MISRVLAVTVAALSLWGCGSDSSGNPATCPGTASSPCSAAGAAGATATGGNAGAGGGSAGASGAGGTAGADADVVVDASWLAAEVVNDTVQVLDVRPATDIDAGHIPGSRYVNLDDLRATVNGVPSQVADNATLSQVLSAQGLDPNLGVVVVGAQTDTTPARVFWTLEWAKQPSVKLLDGGFPAWTQNGGSSETGTPTAPATSYAVSANATERRVDADWILPKLGDPSVVLIDARAASEYAAGHIPGALNVDWQQNVSAGALKPKAELEALYAAVPKTATVVAYCHTGTRGSVTYFVLRSLGYPDVRLYDGSWAEWGSRPDLPKEP